MSLFQLRESCQTFARFRANPGLGSLEMKNPVADDREWAINTLHLVPTSFCARLWKTPEGGRPGLEVLTSVQLRDSTGLEPVSPECLPIRGKSTWELLDYLTCIVAVD